MPAPQSRNKTHVPVVPYEQCWAKTTSDGLPGIGVAQHCRNVGYMARALLETIPQSVRKLFPDGTMTLAAAHDIGKVSPDFQAQCPAFRKRWQIAESLSADHAACTQRTLLQRYVEERWAQIAGAHHGKIKPPQAGHTDWNAERERLLSALISEFGSLPVGEPSEAILFLVAGLISVSDWMGSDERLFPQDISPEAESALVTRAAGALDAIGWRTLQPRRGAAFAELFPEIAAPNSLQLAATVFVDRPGLYLVEAPMGYGKTEAALAAAYCLMEAEGATGLYFALPTQTTSNRIHLRVRAWAANALERTAPVRLAHGASWLVENVSEPRPAPQPQEGDTESQTPSWFASSKRALLMPIGVGTVDQALLGVLAVKHFFVRQFALAGKVVVLDEVHSYDMYTGTLINMLVRRLREVGTTVIVLSATLTDERKRELLNLDPGTKLLSAYPLLSSADENGNLRQEPCEPPPSQTVHIRHFDSSPFAEALQEASRGVCVLWIRNTVGLAQDTFRRLQEAAPRAIALGLLHSRFPFFRREELEKQWMEALGKGEAMRPKGCILVGTQVLEQSVDIDADLLITDLAPTDMLLQRLGRLWRHDRQNRPREAPEAWIEMPSLDALGPHGKVYAPYVLARSSEQWRGRNKITLPDQIRTVLESTYSPATDHEPEPWALWRRELEEKKQSLQRKAVHATRVWQSPFLEDIEGMGTRWSEVDSASLVLVRERDERLWTFLDRTRTSIPAKWNMEAARAVHRNLVRVPAWLLAGSSKQLSPFVDGSSAIGMVEQSGSLRVLQDQANKSLVYDAQLGILISE